MRITPAAGSSTTSTPRQCSGRRGWYRVHAWLCEEVGHGDAGPGESRGQGGAPLPSRQGRCVHCEESGVGRLPVRSLQGVQGPRVQNTVSEIN